MPTTDQTTTHSQRPHVLRGDGNLRFRGAGTLCIRLLGRGLLDVRRGPHDEFHYTGRGKPRHFSSDHLAITNGKGLVQVEGEDLDVRLDGAVVDVAVIGQFSCSVQGQGVVAAVDGTRLTWGVGKTLTFDGMQMRQG